VLELRGITWAHPRGLAPLLATAQAFEREQGDVHISWTARSLQAFGEQSIEELAAEYDLLVIDHPFVGTAARSRCLVPLDEHLPAAFLAAQAEQSVGESYQSYLYDGHLWALAIDAAAQVSAYRPDLMAVIGRAIPQTWDEVLDLAREARTARIAIPLTPVNTICSFFTLCASHGEPPGSERTRLVSRAIGRTALTILRRLVQDGHPESLSLDPPRALERMAHGDAIAYCPALFGYSNYARPGYAPHLCRFTNIPSSSQGGRPRGSTLGGAGLAISSSCRALPQACAYAQWVASAECQRTIYVESGGQPGNRLAWTDPAVNAATSNFFLDTLATLENAYVRARYDGFVPFQEKAGYLIHDYLRDRGDEEVILDALDALYVDSQKKH
jgi:multiple sugar transport system substrate-binding protein